MLILVTIQKDSVPVYLVLSCSLRGASKNSLLGFYLQKVLMTLTQQRFSSTV